VKLDPLVGQPNPELKRISAPQKAMLLVIAVGIIVLIGAVLSLPTAGRLFH
jgi:hypothetical protein